MNRKEAKTKIQPNPQPAGDRQRTGTSASVHGAGKHFRDTAGGPSDLERNPGIGSSGGTFAIGESGINETDETTGVVPKPR